METSLKSVKWKKKRVKRDKDKAFREQGEDGSMVTNEETSMGGGDSVRHK